MTPITWYTSEGLGALLQQRYPPAGLAFWTFVQGPLAEAEPSFPELPPFEIEEDPPYGSIRTWSGIVDGEPFRLSLGRAYSRWGFGVALPIRVNAAGVLDVSPLLLLARLPSSLWASEHLYFENFPAPGPGFGVVSEPGGFPIFRSPLARDATDVLEFLRSFGHTKYSVAPLPALPTAWVAAGPVRGPYMGAIDVCDTRKLAESSARKMAARRGQRFVVYEGGLAGPPVAAFPE